MIICIKYWVRYRINSMSFPFINTNQRAVGHGTMLPGIIKKSSVLIIMRPDKKKSSNQVDATFLYHLRDFDTTSKQWGLMESTKYLHRNTYNIFKNRYVY